MKDVLFPGLNALEFFEVYFADDAPYSFKEFQSTKGDIDIEYGKWKRRAGGSSSNGNDSNCSQDVNIHSFHPAASQQQTPSPTFPTSSRKERVLNFKTLTKSYFGPAYATARKTQRVSKFSTRLVIIESKTELFDIPFSDRFFVVERWVIEADKNSSSLKGCIYTAKLSVSVQVFMVKSCNWEKQIQSKTLSTMKELLESWTNMATQALGLAIQKKLERRKVKQRDDASLKSYRSDKGEVKQGQIETMESSDKGSASTPMNVTSPRQEKAFQMHQEKLKVIEQQFSTGDLEWCDIEMRHCEQAGAKWAFAEVLYPGDENRPIEISISDATSASTSTSKLQKKGVRRLFKNRK